MDHSHHTHNSHTSPKGFLRKLKIENVTNGMFDMSLHSAMDVTQHTRCSTGGQFNLDVFLHEMKIENLEVMHLHRIFCEHDTNGDGQLDLEEFVCAFAAIDPSADRDEAVKLFEEADISDSGYLDYGDFFSVTSIPQIKLQAMKQTNIRDNVGLVQIKPCEGKCFDEDLYERETPGISKIELAKGEMFSMQLYESRIASLQRFVAMTVLFHKLAQHVQSFFNVISFGLWNYKIHRTHSIMRVATTASPVSGAHVRKQMEVWEMVSKLNRSVRVISAAWFEYKRSDERLEGGLKRG